MTETDKAKSIDNANTVCIYFGFRLRVTIPFNTEQKDQNTLAVLSRGKNTQSFKASTKVAQWESNLIFTSDILVQFSNFRKVIG